MSKRRRMEDRYRHFSFLSDIEGIKNAIGEMRGMFSPTTGLESGRQLGGTEFLARRRMVYSDH